MTTEKVFSIKQTFLAPHINSATVWVEHKHTYIHIHPFNGPCSGTTQVSQYQKGKTNLNFTEARDSEWQWQWHQLGHMQVCTSLQADNHASTPPLSFFTGRTPFLPPNQQRQSNEGNEHWRHNKSAHQSKCHLQCECQVQYTTETTS